MESSIGTFRKIFAIAVNQPVPAIIIVAVVAAVLWMVLFPQPAQEIRANQLQDARQAQAQQETEREAEYLCRLVSICSKFATVRQDCATAGNFDNCVKIKLGEEKFSETTYCTADGRLNYTPSIPVPSKLACLIGSLGN